MKRITNTTNEEKAKLQPFPFNGDEKYLLKLADGRYVVAYWDLNEFDSDYDDECIQEDIESIVSLKDLGL